MKVNKIDKDLCVQMLTDGKTVGECARHFGVTPAAVCKIKKKTFGVIIAKDLQLESVHRFVGEYLDTVGQLRKINTDAHELLNLCMAWVKGDEEAIQVLESQLSTKRIRVGGKLKKVEEIKMQDPKVVALKAMAEIRSQLALQNQTLAMLAEMSAIHEFQQELVQVLKEVDQEVCDEFCRRIDQRQALRRAIKLDRAEDQGGEG
jgi:exoribonuclease R